jgi:pimeloyl-ACP methyl ester carboxylesterase
MKKITLIVFAIVIPLAILIAIELIIIPGFPLTPNRNNQDTSMLDFNAEKIPIIKPEVKYKEYDEVPANEGAKYFEKVVKIGTELVYIALPLKVETQNPPTLIVYSHGSNTTVTRDFSNRFMKDMQMYGKYFTKRGYAFSASSMHGANWGSDRSVEDLIDMKAWINKKYLIQEKIHLFAFSMGGLPTFNFIFKYPRLVNSVALLAPSSRIYSESQLAILDTVSVHIWHGNMDLNVPHSRSSDLKNRYDSFGFTNLTLNTIKGKGHFDIDTELVKNVFQFLDSK